MKRLITILNLLFTYIAVIGQTKIIFDESFALHTERTSTTFQWTINGVTFTPTISEVTVYPHEKGLDTIFFQETRAFKTKFDTIFSRIPNNQELIITIGCCDEGFDILKKDKEKEKLMDSLYSKKEYDEALLLYATLLEFGYLKFEIFNKPVSDTLICIYSPISITGQMITINKDYGWVEPCRSSEIDNMISIYIAKLNDNICYEIYEIEDKTGCTEGIDIVGWNGNKKLEILKQFRLRLFNNEKVIIQYDYLTGKIKLIIDE
ncbi:MAG TPA: hypothetical protein PLF32_08875 [Bacteroidales bacterium]|jgi:hypothetical protein|nr:hypothetical protein [Bacteroidales bacterium]HOR82751.1 hypothetical protein [Bacteroidales bacterium]HPJ91967.1 hypothetical protein [Bacteroidales bacterium]